MGLLSSRWNDLLALVFPVCCDACDRLLMASENVLCTQCLAELPRVRDNSIFRGELHVKFLNYPEVKSVNALFVYEKGGKVQKMMHRLKYNGREEIAVFLGKIWFNELMTDNCFPLHSEVVTGIPLHKRKKKERGYNQADAFAKSIAEASGVKFSENILTKKRDTLSQTGKSREERVRDMEGVFKISGASLEAHRIILVDDILTTGATMTAAVRTLTEAGATEIHIMTIAAATIS